MQKEDCFYLGSVQRKHGYKGDFIAKFDADDVLLYQGIEAAFFDFKGELVPLPLTKCEFLKKDTFLLHIEGYDTEESLYKVLNSELYLPLDLLPKLEGNEFYYHEIIGFEVIDEIHGNIGTINQVRTDTAQDLIYITSSKDSSVEIIIPIIDNIFKGLSRKEKTFSVKAPEGLIDLYFQDHKQSDEE